MFIDENTCRGLLELLKRVPVTGTSEAQGLVAIVRNVEMELHRLTAPPPLPDVPAPSAPEPTRQQRRAMQAAARKAAKTAPTEAA